ncbi:HYR domain-containing protein [Pseudophaeobacter sp.]|uniref:HYR domain-containing protein n=1 Tax=Pseudophaeobacter sp. TaxID=1971739 RepID=UPI003A97F7B0
MSDSGTPIGVAGGAYWFNGNKFSSFPSVSEAVLAACLGTDASHFTNLQQAGAEVSFADDTYVGFSFTLTQDNQYFTAGNFEYSSATTSIPSPPDTTAPVLSAPSAQNRPTDAGLTTASFDVTSLGFVSDNVDSGLSITYKVGSTTLTGAYVFPLGETTVTMDAQDAAGNNAAQKSFTVTVSDAEAPALTAPAAQTGNTDSGVATASIDVTSLGSVSDNVDSSLSITYKVGSTTLTGAYDFPVGETTVTMDAQDTAGNNAAQKSFTVTVSDAEAPALTAPAAQTGNTDSGVATASIDVTSLGSVSDNVDSSLSITYKVGSTTLTGAYDFPLGETTVTMDAQDAAGNDAAQVSFTVTVSDADMPVLTAPDAQTADTDSGATTASLDVTSLGSVSDNVDGNLVITYKVGDTVLTGAYDFPVGETTVTMDAQDSAGNDAVQVSFTVTVSDTSPPPVPTVANVVVNADRTLTVSGTTEPGATVTVTFPDGSSATTMASGGTAALARGTLRVRGAALAPQPVGNYSVVSATPQTSGNITVTATDANGNTSDANLTVVDATSPDVVISGAPERLTHKASFEVTITFSESVTGFEASDITASHATVTGLSGSGAIYTATIASVGTGNVGLSVAAGAAVDAAGNVTNASNTLVVSDTTVEETQKTIASFLYSRANQLLSNQPDLTGFLDGTSDGTLNAAVTRGRGHFNLASGASRNAWFRLKGAWSEDDTADSRSVFGAFGGHIHLRETVLLGAMLQFDHLSQDDGASRVEGTGWLVGPYVVAKLPGDPLYFEGRLLYGKSSNSVSPFGTYEDDFDTSRLLAQVKVTGEIASQGTLFSPYMDAAYVKEDQDGYTDSLGNAISAQTVDLMQVSFGLDAERSIAIQNGALTLRGGISGIWSSTGGTAVAETVLPGYAGWRGKLDAGVSYVSASHGTFTASAFFDGLGASDYQSYGVSVGYALAF